MLTIDQIPRHNARLFGSKLAIADRSDSYTWREAESWVNRIAYVLLDLGLSAGKRVAILAQNSANLVLLNYAAARTGALAVPLNYWLRERELGALLAELAPAALVYSSEYRAAALAAVELAGTGTPCLLLADDEPEGAQSVMSRAASLSERAPLASMADEGDPYMVIYSSGTTTGKSKGVVRTHRLAFLNAMNAALEFQATESDRIVLSTPNFHVSFWDTQMQWVCLCGGSVWVEAAFRPDSVLLAMAEFKATIVFGIPTTYRQMLGAAEFSRHDFSAIRLVILPARVETNFVREVADAFRVSVREVRNGWGMTETGPCCVFLRGDDWVSRPGASGRDVHLMETRVVDADGAELGPGQVGEIAVRGDILTPGYLDAPEETAAAFRDGWFFTGDLGHKDDEGFLYFFERKKAVIKRGGENISAQEVEAFLSSHPAVAEVAVIPVPDPHWDETPLAVVVLNPGAVVTADELTAYCRAGLAGFKVPQHFEFTEELPHVSLGKIAKQQLVAAYAPRFAAEVRA